MPESVGAPLIVAAHGTNDPVGRRAVESCAARAAAELGVPHRVGYVDVADPCLDVVLSGVARPDPVIVPLFLTTGHHVRHDVPRAADAAGIAARVTPALGAAPEVVAALRSRIGQVDPAPDAVVLATAGSGYAMAHLESALLASRLRTALQVPVIAAVLSGPGTTPDDALAGLRANGHRRIVVATHLLAAGFFHRRATRLAGSDVRVTMPLADTAEISGLVARRYREASIDAGTHPR